MDSIYIEGHETFTLKELCDRQYVVRTTTGQVYRQRYTSQQVAIWLRRHEGSIVERDGDNYTFGNEYKLLTPKWTQVMDLYNEGLKRHDIAKETGLSLSYVEMVLINLGKLGKIRRDRVKNSGETDMIDDFIIDNYPLMNSSQLSTKVGLSPQAVCGRINRLKRWGYIKDRSLT